MNLVKKLELLWLNLDVTISLELVVKRVRWCTYKSFNNLSGPNCRLRMLTPSIFSKPIQDACRSGAMMGTLLSSLSAKLKGGIEWNYLDTILWIHTPIWMKIAHPCHQNTTGLRIVDSHSEFFLSCVLELSYQGLVQYRVAVLLLHQYALCLVQNGMNIPKIFSWLR